MGVVYKAGEQIGQINISRVVWWLKFGAGILGRLGLILILVGIVGIGWVYQPLLTVQIQYAWKQTELAKLVAYRPVEKASWQAPDENFSVYVPKIEARAKVVPNVNVGDKREYMQKLRLGVAQAAGLSDPGELGTTYLFAHSVGDRLDFARYNAVFYLLDKVNVGDAVEIKFKNQIFKYQITGREILEASDTRYFKNDLSQERVVLQTCYPPGTSWKRLVVVGKRI